MNGRADCRARRGESGRREPRWVRNRDRDRGHHAQILEAEGRLEASRRDAKAQVVLAEASQTAINKISSAIGEDDTAVVGLLGEKYLTALQELSASENSKSVVFPADVPLAIRGLLGKA